MKRSANGFLKGRHFSRGTICLVCASITYLCAICASAISSIYDKLLTSPAHLTVNLSPTKTKMFVGIWHFHIMVTTLGAASFALVSAAVIAAAAFVPAVAAVVTVVASFVTVLAFLLLPLLLLVSMMLFIRWC